MDRPRINAKKEGETAAITATKASTADAEEVVDEAQDDVLMATDN